MRAKQKCSGSMLPASQNCRMISGTVRAEFQSGYLDLFSEPLARRKMRFAKGRAVYATLDRRANLCQLIECGPHPLWVNAQVMQVFCGAIHDFSKRKEMRRGGLFVSSTCQRSLSFVSLKLFVAPAFKKSEM